MNFMYYLIKSIVKFCEGNKYMFGALAGLGIIGIIAYNIYDIAHDIRKNWISDKDDVTPELPNKKEIVEQKDELPVTPRPKINLIKLEEHNAIELIETPKTNTPEPEIISNEIEDVHGELEKDKIQSKPISPKPTHVEKEEQKIQEKKKGFISQYFGY